MPFLPGTAPADRHAANSHVAHELFDFVSSRGRPGTLQMIYAFLLPHNGAVCARHCGCVTTKRAKPAHAPTHEVQCAGHTHTVDVCAMRTHLASKYIFHLRQQFSVCALIRAQNDTATAHQHRVHVCNIVTCAPASYIDIAYIRCRFVWEYASEHARTRLNAVQGQKLRVPGLVWSGRSVARSGGRSVGRSGVHALSGGDVCRRRRRRRRGWGNLERAHIYSTNSLDTL